MARNSDGDPAIARDPAICLQLCGLDQYFLFAQDIVTCVINHIFVCSFGVEDVVETFSCTLLMLVIIFFPLTADIKTREKLCRLLFARA